MLTPGEPLCDGEDCDHEPCCFDVLMDAEDWALADFPSTHQDTRIQELTTRADTAEQALADALGLLRDAPLGDEYRARVDTFLARHTKPTGGGQ
jgi:hypothetical protein